MNGRPYIVGEIGDWPAGRNGTSRVPYIVGGMGDWLAGWNGTRASFFSKDVLRMHVRKRKDHQEMYDINAWNSKVTEEFRANGGKVSGQYEGARLLLLTTTGAKSGLRRTTPLGYLSDGDRMIVAASMLGAPKNPDWYHNLVAHPEVTIEIGAETFDTIATVVEGKERERLWAKFAEAYPMLAEHQAKTTRPIPLVALKR
jgi:deazaflavin-dependent oxidoreductase (nitroreductase family)